MSDWRDVMEARSEATYHADRAIEGVSSAADQALVEALLAIRAELRALGVTIDYANSNRKEV